MSDEQRVYRLSAEHSAWSDNDDTQPDRPETPAELKPLFLSGDTVEDVDDLGIYHDYPSETPHFHEDSFALEATPEEVAEWQRVYAGVEKAQHRYRVNMQAALKAYQRAHRDALTELSKATGPWLSVEAELKERSTALATKMAAHREAAEKWKKEQYDKEQAHLDTIHGPRVIVLYEPSNLSGQNKAGHIARVHLADCKRRRGSSVRMRAGEAWEALTGPDWPRASWPGSQRNLRVKMCSFCKPWTVLAEHAGVTTEMLRTEIRLAEWPEGLT